MKKLNRVLAIFGVFAMMSCGNGQKEEEEKITIGNSNQTESAVEETTNDASSSTMQSNEEGVVQLTIEGNDQMQFNKNELRAKAGETVSLTLKHVGQLPKNVMGHNVVILKQGTDVTDFAQRANQAASNDYIPEGGDDVVAHTKMIGGEESTTIEFEAPTEPGTYTFICSFPGHYVQMQGQFIVE
ncbi:azurin [Salinimicrobium sp. GXAS 041]|uniref:azurin n=1 Tax=Salinimicrobium sp. GXAS 041 TaxID=3400806 RepID=UPI003C720C8C